MTIDMLGAAVFSMNDQTIEVVSQQLELFRNSWSVSATVGVILSFLFLRSRGQGNGRSRRFSCSLVVRVKSVFADHLVYVFQQLVETQIHIIGRQRRRFGEQQTILVSKQLGLLCGYSTQMVQIALVSHQLNDNIGIGMFFQLLQPPRNRFIRLRFQNVIHNKRPHRSTIVCAGDGPVPLSTSSIPNLSFNSTTINF
ncbi:hypothetical protein PGUG_04121 [Meyerozyma guilliermondii ATCC 6260]|uniref:Uncharacterized protein n=1 Tax=Meyerozyma guilliermondii (strain ATCC 6260 / CBS 566 / DSM 6381 / JCM 1539 / NBRC 10279 / NRRL Y-324) TaxID=294746 RepID=A5DLH0_PICGU|nr:uncharacterized protein PGUG_04121 [Meyerozyma guilliermondii ATCC 6260]EDK40023.2 hypothetical protein PGUG_04121 [Meyerozyma guilliermondii ATCC 6260]